MFVFKFFLIVIVIGVLQVMSLDFTGRYNNWDSVDPVSRVTSLHGYL